MLIAFSNIHLKNSGCSVLVKFPTFSFTTCIYGSTKNKQNFIYSNKWCNSASAVITQFNKIYTASMFVNAQSYGGILGVFLYRASSWISMILVGHSLFPAKIRSFP